MPTQEDWNKYLLRFLELQQHPVAFAWLEMVSIGR
jgi:hypothetical protein